MIDDPPLMLQTLLFDPTASDGKNYQANTTSYNAMFSFPLPGMKFDTKFTKGGGPPTLRLYGHAFHRIKVMLPEIGQPPKDNKHIDMIIVTNLRIMLDQNNVHAKGFRMTRDMLKHQNVKDLKLRLISGRQTDGRVYNKPTIFEVVALINGDIDYGTKRYIIIQECGVNL
ncbi:hypothetical protein KIW84_062469 [Lathyrus oleraceus]|uniref:Uncharacterized protein n=1 Tax=Pisum sativum TaxID=3888 RepID=A0A9D5A8E1_PEA|nr:hypothetical protein KIW84_062469 [Pisum sativum]